MEDSTSERSCPDKATAGARLRHYTRTGKTLDLRTCMREANDPAAGQAWSAERTIAGELICELVTTVYESASRPRAVALIGARIAGGLNLTGLSLTCPLLLHGCYLDGPINLDEADAKVIRVTGTHLPCISAYRASVSGDVDLRKSTADVIGLLAAHIKGNLDLSGAHLTGGRYPPDLSGVTVGAEQLAEVRAVAKHLQRAALVADRVQIGGALIASELVAAGEIRIWGARVAGACVFTDAKITAGDHSALNAEELVVDGHMFCNGAFTATGEALSSQNPPDGDLVYRGLGSLHLANARIGGNCDLAGAGLHMRGARALDGEDLVVEGHLFCNNGFVADGEVSLDRASVSGGCYLQLGASAVSLASAHIGGELVLSGGDSARGGEEGVSVETETPSELVVLSGVGLTVERDVVATEGLVTRGAIDLYRAHIKGSCRLMNVSIDGDLAVNLAHIGGTCNLDGATLKELSGYRVVVDGDMFCMDGFSADRVYLAGAQIRGLFGLEIGIAPIELDYAHVGGVGLAGSAADRSAEHDKPSDQRPPFVFDAFALTVDRDFELFPELVANGLSLVKAHIKGGLRLNDAKLRAGRAEALDGEHLVVDGDVDCTEGFEVDGDVSLTRAHVAGDLVFLLGRGQLNLVNAQVDGSLRLGSDMPSDPAGTVVGKPSEQTPTEQEKPVVAAFGLVVGRDLAVYEGFAVKRELDLAGARIRGQCDMRHAALRTGGSRALNAEDLIVDGDMLCSEGFAAEGQLLLTGARIGGLLALEGATLDELVLVNARVSMISDDDPINATAVRLDGCVYEHLEVASGASLQSDVVRRLRWLRQNSYGYLPQPYEQLMAYYRQIGNDDGARSVGIAKLRHRRDVLSPLAKLGDSFAYWIVGYGYRMRRAIVFLAFSFVAGDVLLAWRHSADIRPRARGGPPFHSLIYTLDTIIPIVNLHERDAFIAHGPAQVVATVLAIVGWALTTVIVAGASGVFKRD